MNRFEGIRVAYCPVCMENKSLRVVEYPAGKHVVVPKIELRCMTHNHFITTLYIEPGEDDVQI